jgi:hypothetical protein
VEPNESENAARQVAREPELPDLAVRALSDFERIIAAEAHLLETNLLVLSNKFLERLYVQSIVITIAALGTVMLLVGVALILHRWQPWWRVMGILGVFLLVAAEVLRRTVSPSKALVSRT